MKVIIVGAGLVGSLSACMFGQRGHEVLLYEYRPDPRSRAGLQLKGRSINLALSTRGRAGLRAVGLEHALIHEHALPMYSRMIHDLHGATRQIPYDPNSNQAINSVSRKHLNQLLLDKAETFPNVQIHFEHKMINGELDQGLVIMEQKNGDRVRVQGDLVVGADGAFSAVRRLFLKQPLFNFSQEYIEHGYLELAIPPDSAGNFKMWPESLHIWPRGAYMMIALPNQDRSWTVTLFMPHSQFAQLDKPKALLEFFRQNFPDSLPLLGEEQLVKDFFATPPSFLLSVKCSPYHLGNKAVLIGDAAHAMVPFYGQGMNAGFEDCLILDRLLHEDGLSVEAALAKFSESRPKDAHAICDLAMYNYTEMRDLVNRPWFIWRKRLDALLYSLLKNSWVPLYNSVTFSTMEYSACVANKLWQDKMLSRVLVGGCVLVSSTLLTSLIRHHSNRLTHLFNIADSLYLKIKTP